MSLIAEKDTGLRRVVLAIHWPVKHQLRHLAYGWTVSRDVCGGDSSTTTTATYETEAEARAAFDELDGELIE
jgi:hypothetical protein